MFSIHQRQKCQLWINHPLSGTCIGEKSMIQAAGIFQLPLQLMCCSTCIFFLHTTTLRVVREKDCADLTSCHNGRESPPNHFCLILSKNFSNRLGKIILSLNLAYLFLCFSEALPVPPAAARSHLQFWVSRWAAVTCPPAIHKKQVHPELRQNLSVRFELPLRVHTQCNKMPHTTIDWVPYSNVSWPGKEEPFTVLSLRSLPIQYSICYMWVRIYQLFFYCEPLLLHS